MTTAKSCDKNGSKLGNEWSFVNESPEHIVDRLHSEGIFLPVEGDDFLSDCNHSVLDALRRDDAYEAVLEYQIEQEVLRTLRPASPVPEYKPMPIEVFSTPVQRHVESVAKSIGIDPALVGTPVIGVMAGAIGSTYQVQAKRDQITTLAVWVTTVSPSATGKSPALSKCAAPLETIDHDQHEAHQRAMEDHVAAVDHAKRKKRPAPEPPVKQQLTVGDITVEALVKCLQNNPRGVVMVDDELARWFASFGLYKGGDAGGRSDSSLWRTIYDGRPLRRDRAGGDNVYVHSPNVCVVGTIQPWLLEQALTTEHWHSGLAQRLLFCVPPAEVPEWTEYATSKVVEDTYARHIECLHSLQHADDGSPMALTLKPETRRLYHAYTSRLRPKIQAEMEPYRSCWAKSRDAVLRIAGILHLDKWAASDDDYPSLEIEPETMESSILLGEWFRDEATRWLAEKDSTAGLSDDESHLVRWIDERWAGEWVHQRAIQREIFRRKSADEIRELFASLKKAGYGTTRAAKRSIEFYLFEKPPNSVLDQYDCDKSGEFLGK